MSEIGNSLSENLQTLFERQKQDFDASDLSWEKEWNLRKKRLTVLRRVVCDNARDIAQVISSDFHGRRFEETALSELMQVTAEIDLMLGKAKRWAETESCPTPWKFFPASSRTVCQPRGVVGVIGAWNYPLALSLMPVADALAAGNRVMIKLPERSRASSVFLESLLNKAFDPTVLVAFVGDREFAKAFSNLPFDLLFYTGGAAVGREVMRVAASNLTPVVLELGGKSEALIAPEADMKQAVRRLLVGKILNAGQTCIAPDVVRVPASQLGVFMETVRFFIKRLCPNPQKVTALIDEVQAQRIQGLLEDARLHGTRIEKIMDPVAGDVFRPGFFLMIDPPEEAAVSKEEIFGPLFLVRTYDDIEQEIKKLRARTEKPLALYWFDRNKKRIARIERMIPCGGVTVNDTLLHFAQNRLPFGGIRTSGIGQYHGRAGFDAMSHRVPVFEQSRFSCFGWLDPPYSLAAKALIRFFMR